VWSSSRTGSPRIPTRTSACQTSTTFGFVGGGSVQPDSWTVALRVPDRNRRRFWEPSSELTSPDRPEGERGTEGRLALSTYALSIWTSPSLLGPTAFETIP